MAERAWPFEGVEEREKFHRPEQFIEARGQDTEAVLVRIGLHDAQLVLVDKDGRWQRWVYHSMEETKQVAEELGVTVHENEYPEELRVLINSYVRPPADFDRSAYPEQGVVGPVIPYPENRPRSADADRPRQKETQEKEASEPTSAEN